MSLRREVLAILRMAGRGMQDKRRQQAEGRAPPLRASSRRLRAGLPSRGVTGRRASGCIVAGSAASSAGSASARWIATSQPPGRRRRAARAAQTAIGVGWPWASSRPASAALVPASRSKKGGFIIT